MRPEIVDTSVESVIAVDEDSSSQLAPRKRAKLIWCHQCLCQGIPPKIAPQKSSVLLLVSWNIADSEGGSVMPVVDLASSILHMLLNIAPAQSKLEHKTVTHA